jgi:uncharacterized protein
MTNHSSWSPPSVDWVIKISRFCNLRCHYCYEFEHLAEQARMSLADLERMFRHIAMHYAGSGKTMNFVWHGGEPLLIEADYYAQIGALQARIFGAAELAYRNYVQTNLVKMTPSIFALIKDFFDGVSVSIDFFGDHRVNVAGRPIEARVKQNMQRLKEAGIRFGCISVLSRSNVSHVDEIYRYVEAHGYSLRLLPIYRQAFPGQQDGLALSAEEIVNAYIRLADLWLASDQAIQVRPLADYLTHIVRKITLGTDGHDVYDKRHDEVAYIVGTDGSVYSIADAYVESLCHGNLFHTPIAEMRAGARYARVVAQANERVSTTCHHCEFYGPCSGFIMAEATDEERYLDAHGQLHCGIAKPLHAYLERRLLESGVFGESVAA